MSEMIKDGTGTGYMTKVGSDNRMHTDSLTEIKIVNLTEKGQAYNFSIVDAPVSGGVETNLIFVRNTDPEKSLYIHQYIVAYNGGSTNYNKIAKFYSKNGTGLPTSGHTTGTPINILAGSTATANALFYVWDKTTAGGMVMTSAGSKGLGLVLGPQTLYHRLDGALILPPGTDRCMAINAVETGTVSITIHAYYDILGA